MRFSLMFVFMGSWAVVGSNKEFSVGASMAKLANGFKNEALHGRVITHCEFGILEMLL